MDTMLGKSKGFIDEFKAFAVQGNMIDLAVGIVIGTAFNAIITSLVGDIIMPIIGTIFGKPDFTSLVLGSIKIGSFLTSVVNFLIIALSVFLTLKIIIRWMPKKEVVAE